MNINKNYKMKQTKDMVSARKINKLRHAKRASGKAAESQTPSCK